MSWKSFKLSELDFNNIGGWPKAPRFIFCGLVGFVILVISWLLFISSQRDTLSSLESKESGLRDEFVKEQGRATNLIPLKHQLEQMERVLQHMLRQLPSKTEMPDLINDISQTAIASGLTNELFQPGPEVLKEFYAEKPISLRMVGTYHQFGAFVSAVASLPRVVILTMHDINLRPREQKGGIAQNGLLELSGTVKTYRYLDEQEVVDQEKAAAAARKGGS